MASENINFLNQVQEYSSLLSSKEQMLGKGLNIPNNATNSGARKIMNGTHQSHTLVLSHSEIPYVGTGYENRFGDESSSIITMEDDLQVIAKIPKFSYAPNHHYYLILKNERTKTLHMIERVSYLFRTEVYGYLHNNSILDSYSNIGTIIPKGTVIRTSTAFDKVRNRTNGKNLNVVYMSLDNNMEDSVIISEDCSQKLAAPLLRRVRIVMNENDILLNLYGDDDVYKSFPDIGEEIKDGILMAYRREKKEESIYSQSVNRLQNIMMSDEKITLKGRIIDISIFCNNPANISKRAYNGQLLAYYNDRIRFNTALINAVGPYQSAGYKKSYDLEKLFTMCEQELNSVKFVDKSQFSNVEIEFVIMENRILDVGDKVADRYGGKGVISKVVPTVMMPRLHNGKFVHMIKNSSTMYNRENAGQIFELELNFISMCILDKIRDENINPYSALDLITSYIELVTPSEAEKMRQYTKNMSESDLAHFIDSMLNMDAIPVSMDPMSNIMDIDRLADIYAHFPWITPQYMQVPMKDSRGNIRYINTRRPIIAAPQYCLRLKQFAEEKFSAASLSSTNIKNENTKSKASKNYREPNSNTPIKFGQMESGDLDHMGTEYVVLNLMLHSLSPHARRLVEQVVLGDPFNVDVKINTKAKNRSVEILNARLKTMGFRISFEKKPKKIKMGAYIPAITFDEDPNQLPAAIDFIENDKCFDIDKYISNLEKIAEIKKKKDLEPAVYFEEDLDPLAELLLKEGKLT